MVLKEDGVSFGLGVLGTFPGTVGSGCRLRCGTEIRLNNLSGPSSSSEVGM